VLNRTGGVSIETAGDAESPTVGFATGATSGLAIFRYRANGVTVSEATVPAMMPLQNGRIYAESGGAVRTGIAIANANDASVNLSYYFTDSNGNNFGQDTIAIPAKAQMAQFLNEAPFNSGEITSATFTFNASAPISVIALRGLVNERSEFLISTLPVTPVEVRPVQDQFLAHFADGGGWTTQVMLINPTDAELRGSVEFVAANGIATGTRFDYVLAARGAQRFHTNGTASTIQAGSIRISPAAGTSSPSAAGIFSFRQNGVTVSEAGIAAVPASAATRLFVEAAGNLKGGEAGSLMSGVAISNPSSSSTVVSLELRTMGGVLARPVSTILIPARGQVAMFLNEIAGIAGFAAPLQGVLTVNSSPGVAVTGLRGRYNERGEFLITATPPLDNIGSGAVLVFPHLADGGGYKTQLVLTSPQVFTVSSGTLQFFSQSGRPLGLTLR
jgi:hypothetical protein